MSLSPLQSVARICLWHKLQAEARRKFERAVARDPDTYGIAPTESQRREERRKLSGKCRSARGKNRAKGVQ